MRIPSGTTDQYIYFVAVDATDFTTRETGIADWTVYRSRDGAAAAVMTTPTINETDSTNMPGVYELLLDEDMTIAAGNTEEEMAFHIRGLSGSPLSDQMAPVTRSITLFRPTVTEGNTLDVTATGAAGIDWANVENPTTTVGLTGTTVDLITDAVDATAVASNAIDASALATDAVTEIAAGVATHQLVDLASADGTLPTIQQALYELVQQTQESVLTGTTVSVKKQDGSTELFTLTVNDGTNPTSITRAT